MTVVLTKGSPQPLGVDGDITFRVIWQAVEVKGFLKRQPKLDLDASIGGLNANGGLIEFCYHGHKLIDGGVIRHAGDTTAKRGNEAHEDITAKLDELDPEIQALVCVLNAWEGADWQHLASARCEIYSGDTLVARSKLELDPDHRNNAYAMVKVYRQGNQWMVERIDAGAAIGGGIDDIKRFLIQKAGVHS